MGTIPAGQLAIILAVLSVGVIPVINLILQRLGIFVTRRTEIDKMYMERLKTVEQELKDCQGTNTSLDTVADGLRTTIQMLREQHVEYMVYKTQVEENQKHILQLEEKCAILSRGIDKITPGISIGLD